MWRTRSVRFDTSASERLADFTDDDFAADLLPGNNNENQTTYAVSLH